MRRIIKSPLLCLLLVYYFFKAVGGCGIKKICVLIIMINSGVINVKRN